MRSDLENGLERTAENSVPSSVMVWSKEVAAMTGMVLAPAALQTY